MVTKRQDGQKKRIVIVDDHAIVRQGLAQMINQQGDLEVCGQACDADVGLALIKDLQPDLAIIDISLKDSSGIELLKDVRVRFPEVLTMVLSVHDESFYAERVLRAGGRGYVTKDEQPEAIISAIRQVLAGEVFLSNRMSSLMLSKYIEGPGETQKLSMDRLSDRELEVFEYVGQGMGTRQIAHKLHLSIKTVESHRANIKRKLKLDNATELLQHAIQWVQYDK